MKQLLSTQWNFFRIIRLLMGVMIVVQAIVVKDWSFGFAGFIFALMALFNTGCCAANTCSPKNNTVTPTDEEISYEEVK